MANRDELRGRLSRACASRYCVDCSWHWCPQTTARSQTRSRDVSDPVTDPGVRVRVLGVGSLTPRLLSDTVCASAETAAAMRTESGESLSATANRVARYGDVTRSSNQRRRDDASTGTPGRRGMWSPRRHLPLHLPLPVVSEAKRSEPGQAGRSSGDQSTQVQELPRSRASSAGEVRTRKLKSPGFR
jgi:hypothetical protein